MARAGAVSDHVSPPAPPILLPHGSRASASRRTVPRRRAVVGQQPTRWETFNTNLGLCSGLITAAFAIVAGWLSGKPWHLVLGVAFACFVFAPAISLVVYGELDPDKDKYKYHPWL